MTDYSKMSDAEINQEVTCIINPDAKKMPLIADGSCFYDCGPDGSGFFEIPVRDYCNSWADAGPIILENCISMVWDCAEDASSAWWNAFDQFDNCREQYQSNPLRAAMIVFLMMKEGE